VWTTSVGFPGMAEKTGCSYIWEDSEVDTTRAKLCRDISIQGIEAAEIRESSIEDAMDIYFYKFNFAGLNSLL